MDSKKQYQMPLYRLKHDIPLMKKGAIFYYDENDDRLGSIGEGCLKLAWTKNGDCQQSFCADTIVFHASAIHDTSWFELIKEGELGKYEETEVVFNGEKLYRRI